MTTVVFAAAINVQIKTLMHGIRCNKSVRFELISIFLVPVPDLDTWCTYNQEHTKVIPWIQTGITYWCMYSIGVRLEEVDVYLMNWNRSVCIVLSINVMWVTGIFCCKKEMSIERKTFKMLWRYWKTKWISRIYLL